MLGDGRPSLYTVLYKEYTDRRSVKNEALLKSNRLRALQVPIRVVFPLKYERHRL